MTKYPGAEPSNLIGQLQKHARLGAILYKNTALDMITYVDHNVNTIVNATYSWRNKANLTPPSLYVSYTNKCRLV